MINPVAVKSKAVRFVTTFYDTFDVLADVLVQLFEDRFDFLQKRTSVQHIDACAGDRTRSAEVSAVAPLPSVAALSSLSSRFSRLERCS